MTTEVNEKTEKKGTKRQTQMRKNDGDDYALDELPGGVAEAESVSHDVDASLSGYSLDRVTRDTDPVAACGLWYAAGPENST